jgi:hypothetical protein
MKPPSICACVLVSAVAACFASVEPRSANAHQSDPLDRQASQPQHVCRKGYHWGRFCYKGSPSYTVNGKQVQPNTCLSWSPYQCLPNATGRR